MIPAWVSPYIGIPFLDHGRDHAGCDCWGLVRLVLAEQFGLIVPSLAGDYPSAFDGEPVAALIEREARAWHLVADHRVGDVLVLRLTGKKRHVGLVVDEGLMLHIDQGIDACLERYFGPLWVNRVEGCYRHADAA